MCGKMEDIRYLQDFKSRCAQYDLSNENEALNPEAYFKNLTVISIPLRFKNASVPPDFQVSHQVQLKPEKIALRFPALPQKRLHTIRRKSLHGRFRNLQKRVW